MCHVDHHGLMDHVDHHGLMTMMRMMNLVIDLAADLIDLGTPSEHEV